MECIDNTSISTTFHNVNNNITNKPDNLYTSIESEFDKLQLTCNEYIVSWFTDINKELTKKKHMTNLGLHSIHISL